MLVEQYRMNTLIMQWSSTHMYEDRLLAHPSVSARVLRDILPTQLAEDEEASELSQIPLVFIDTAGSLMYEEVDQEVGKHESKFNFGEVDLVIQMIKELITIGTPEKSIGVITPYSAQGSEIRKQLKFLDIG